MITRKGPSNLTFITTVICILVAVILFIDPLGVWRKDNDNHLQTSYNDMFEMGGFELDKIYTVVEHVSMSGGTVGIVLKSNSTHEDRVKWSMHPALVVLTDGTRFQFSKTNKDPMNYDITFKIIPANTTRSIAT